MFVPQSFLQLAFYSTGTSAGGLTMATADGGKASVVQVMEDLAGLSDEWDALVPLRSRIRTVNRLLTEEAVSGEDAVATKGAVPKTLGNLKHNKHVMGPVLRRLSGNQDKVPCLQALSQEIAAFYDAICVSDTHDME